MLSVSRVVLSVSRVVLSVSRVVLSVSSPSDRQRQTCTETEYTAIYVYM